MDESGTHDGSPYAVVGIVFARDEVWKQWSVDWRSAKGREIDIYHAVDCHSRKKEFSGWTQTKRNDFVKKMLSVCTQHEIYYFVSIIEVSTFKSALKGRQDILEWLNPIHKWCAYFALRSVFKQIAKYDIERVGVYIESSHDDNSISHMAELAKRSATEHGLSVNINFGGKKDYEPFQAADIIAYEAFKQSKNQDRIRKPVSILNRDDNRIWSHKFYGQDAVRLAEDLISIFDGGDKTLSILNIEK